MKKIIIDCDPGIDDLVALAMVANEPSLEVVGITTVAGNQSIGKCTKNAINILNVFDLEIPVYEGASVPVYRDQVNAANIHGDTGIGSVVIDDVFSSSSVQKERAHRFIIEQAHALEGELIVLAIGPLTNLAQAILLDPSIVSKIKKIVLMGGGHQFGNTKPSAEFNFFADPEAAKLVFDSGIHIDMMGLDVTMSTGLTIEDIDQLTDGIAKKKSKVIERALRDILNLNLNYGLPCAYVHDPVALLALVNPELIEGGLYRVDIETKGLYTKGKTVVDIYNTTKKIPNTFVGFKYDKQDLIAKLEALIDLFEQEDK